MTVTIATVAPAWAGFLIGPVCALSIAAPVVAAELSAPRQMELDNMLKHDCGSCHGLRLAGGLGPALTPAALADKSDAVLEQTVRYGRPGTPMPPFEGMLAPDEIRWMINRMRSGRPDVK